MPYHTILYHTIPYHTIPYIVYSRTSELAANSADGNQRQTKTASKASNTDKSIIPLLAYRFSQAKWWQGHCIRHDSLFWIRSKSGR